MRIDIGPEGKIVGTKRVSTSGQIAGLSSFAGKDLLLVEPQGRAEFRFDARDYLAEWQKIAQRESKRAQKQIKALRAMIPSVDEAVKMAKKEIKQVRKDFDPAALMALLPSPQQARVMVEKRLVALRKEKRVKKAEAWVRTQLKPLEGFLAASQN